ncbi:[FeFe] hydrogenase H-cluster radical SAM maturase HydE [Paenibacillus kribbensis]|uniref:[FeFe] hydrogenase H-cluster radical SAM maturase HydE n=1 Tax=Paenibacillus kribbensis TaxID=172713 RepID=UPI002DBA8F41|nr:[FeFe] hydrogenase H-cluster radical SAM maturase HydE [Paenibacillus kribbensis]MEC0237501.1 [FeFe] hydrogenase H-cluster radical SAM maturase HydE [Paenibacillus kribbensis]
MADGKKWTHMEMTGLLTRLDEDPIVRAQLRELAARTKMERYGKGVFLRGLIEFSSICRQDCMYCGLRASNKQADRYRLRPEEILACCTEGYELGYRTFVLQSGEDTWFTTARLTKLIRDIKSRFADVAVTLSIGERDDETYELLYEAGADRFLLRHETASAQLYAKLHPTMTMESRRSRLLALQRIGFQIGAGCMVGLPGQTSSELADDLVYLHSLNPDMIGIGPFLPHSNTPLRDASQGSMEKALDMISLSRLVVPDALIPASTAMGTIHPQGREKALQAGANVVMPNLSPLAVRPKYAIYENKICLGDESAQCRHCLELRIRGAGFEVDMGRGDSLRVQRQFMKQETS